MKTTQLWCSVTVNFNLTKSLNPLFETEVTLVLDWHEDIFTIKDEILKKLSGMLQNSLNFITD